LRIKTIKAASDQIDTLLTEMEPDAVPVAQKPRNVPYHLQKPLKKWLEEGTEK